MVLYAGIDVGGTNIKIGLTDFDGNLLCKLKVATEPSKGVHHAIDKIKAGITELTEKIGASPKDISGFGAGIAGLLNVEKGVLLQSPCLGWDNTPIRKLFQESLSSEVTIDNDANVALLAEMWKGIGKNYSNVVSIILGTGIGGSICLNGQLWRGNIGMAGEIGHMTAMAEVGIRCNCGRVGCLETVSSSTGIIRSYFRTTSQRGLTQMKSKVSTEDIFVFAQNGDSFAQESIRLAAYYLGKSIVDIALLLNPELIIIGGGVSEAGDDFIEMIRNNYLELAPIGLKDTLDIKKSEFGQYSGVVGAALLTKTQAQNN